MTGRPVDSARRALLVGGSLLAVAPSLVVSGVRAQGVQAAPARRVIVVGGALGEVIYAIGEQGRLVATDTTCTWPPPVLKLPKIGYQRTLSAEGLLSLHPDMVLASAEAGPPAVLEQIRAAGVKLQTFPEQHDAESVRGKLTGVAAALGVEPAGRLQLARFDHDWANVRARVEASPLARRTQPLRVLFLLNPSGRQPMVAGQGTAAEAMLRYAGVRNAMEGFKGYRPLTPEAMIGAAPDALLTTDDALQAAGGPQALLASPGLAQTPAGRDKRIVTLDMLLLLGFGPRLPEAVDALNRGLATA